MAGRLGVIITKRLLNKGYLKQQQERFYLTNKGKKFFRTTLKLDIDTLQKKRRQFAPCCIDWTEREYHLAGALGAALLSYFLQERLIIRSKSKPRVVALTIKGKKWLQTNLS